MTDQALYVEYKPTLWDRFGFKFYPDPELTNWRFQEPPEDGFIDGTMCSEVHVRVSWADRLRLLLTGHVALKVYTKTDVEVRRVKSRSQFAVLPPDNV